MTHRRARQTDVARVAGVSQATVSLVLSGNSRMQTRVSNAARQRVLEAAEQLGYAPNPFAQGLVRGRMRILGVLTHDPVFPKDGSNFYHPFLIGVESAAEELGVDLLMFTSTPVVGRRRRLVDAGWNRVLVADGCLLFGRSGDAEEVAQLASRNYPFVYIGRREDTGPFVVPCVGADYYTATLQTMRRLIALGHLRIGLLGDIGTGPWAADRLAGYRDGLLEAGQEPFLFDSSTITPDEAVQAVVRQQMTAIVLAAGDIGPTQLRTAAIAAGVSIPNDLSVAVLGESEAEPSGSTDWSGFTIPRFDIGHRALTLLQSIADGTALQSDLKQALTCQPVTGTTVTRWTS